MQCVMGEDPVTVTRRYPSIEPYECRTLEVANGHQLYCESCGSPDGTPALWLHGGPGSGSSVGASSTHDAASVGQRFRRPVGILRQRLLQPASPFPDLEEGRELFQLAAARLDNSCPVQLIQQKLGLVRSLRESCLSVLFECRPEVVHAGDLAYFGSLLVGIDRGLLIVEEVFSAPPGRLD